MQISHTSSVIVEMMVQVNIMNLPSSNQRLSCRSKEQTAVNQRWSYKQSRNDGYRVTVSKRGYQIYQMKKTWAKRLWLENTVINTIKLLSSIDGPIREPLHVRWNHTLIRLSVQVANLRYLGRAKPQQCLQISECYTIDSYRLPYIFTLTLILKSSERHLLWMSVNILLQKINTKREIYKDSKVPTHSSTLLLQTWTKNCLMKDDCNHGPYCTLDHDRLDSLTGINT